MICFFFQDLAVINNNTYDLIDGFWLCGGQKSLNY